MSEIFVECPHCGGGVIVIALNCAIFRHGVIVPQSGVPQQIPPHERKEECDRLFHDRVIWGCGRPFRVVSEQGSFRAIKCEYI